MRFLVFIGCILAAVLTIQGKEDSAPGLERISRIIGGENIKDINRWPWLVSITAYVPGAKLGSLVLTWKIYYCGASVIDPYWLLTAGHCVDNAREASYWTARVGTLRRSANVGEKIKDFFGKLFHREDWRLFEFGVEQVFRHQNYGNKYNSWQNDITLFKLKKPIPFSDEVKQVKLPSLNANTWPTAGQDCVMKGWGCTEGGGSVTYYAKQVTLPIVENWTCRRTWGVDIDTRLCAGERGQHKGICPGDSGGPLVCQEGNDWVQVGIASFASKNEPGENYGAFTRVSYYVDWIRRTMRDNSGGGGGGPF